MSKVVEQERRADAHEKIQLGGLIVKAGLRECNSAILLGAMIEVAEALEKADTAKVTRWRETGSKAFGKAALRADNKKEKS